MMVQNRKVLLLHVGTDTILEDEVPAGRPPCRPQCWGDRAPDMDSKDEEPANRVAGQGKS